MSAACCLLGEGRRLWCAHLHKLGRCTGFSSDTNGGTMILPSTEHLLLNTRQIFNSSLEHHNWRRTSLSKHVLTCLAALTEVAVNPASR